MSFNQSLARLRKEGIVRGNSISINVESTTADGVWICSSDFMIERLVGKLPLPVLDLLDSTDGKIGLRFEQEDHSWIGLCIDYEGNVGNAIQQFHMPIYVTKHTEIDKSSSSNSDKPVPLQPEFEAAIISLLKMRKQWFNQFLDGSFKLGHSQ